MLRGAKVDGPPAVTDGAELLRRFNQANGVAHTMADQLAAQAICDAEKLMPDVIVTRFTDSATPAITATATSLPATAALSCTARIRFFDQLPAAMVRSRPSRPLNLV